METLNSDVHVCIRVCDIETTDCVEYLLPFTYHFNYPYIHVYLQGLESIYGVDNKYKSCEAGGENTCMSNERSVWSRQGLLCRVALYNLLIH